MPVEQLLKCRTADAATRARSIFMMPTYQPGMVTYSLCWLAQRAGAIGLHYVLANLCNAISVTRRKLQTPGTAEEHKRQETPTINAIDRQPTNQCNQCCKVCPSLRQYPVIQDMDT